MLNLVEPIRSIVSLALLKSIHSWVCALSFGTCRLDLTVCCYRYRQPIADFLQINFSTCLSRSICCHFLYRQPLADMLCESYSEIQPICSWIWRFVYSLSIYRSNWLARLGLKQLHTELGEWCSRAWCVIFSRQHIFWHARWNQRNQHVKVQSQRR